MNFIQSLGRHVLLALALICGVGQTLAEPLYRVTIDTTSLAGRSGYLDFLMLGLSSAEPAQASVQNFTGSFAVGNIATGDVAGSVNGTVTLGNRAPYNEFGQWAIFGGMFAFDISFSTGAGFGAGTHLGIALLDADFGYLGMASDLVTFMLQPGADTAFTSESNFASVGLAPVSTVPEPSIVLQGATGLVLMGAAMCRRRKQQTLPR